jgi:hypothetical protein
MRLIVLVVIICGCCAAARAQESALDRRIQAAASGAAVVWLPDGIADGMFAWRVAESAGLPLIFEALPIEYRDPTTAVERVDLDGLTVRAALGILVAHDPRYSWEERDGVIVIRPGRLMNDPEDRLNQRVAGVRRNRLGLQDVLAGVTASTTGGVSASLPPAIDSRQFPIDAPSGTVLDILVAAARAHGRVMWSAPDGVRGADSSGFSLGYRTFADTGGGAAGVAAR